FGGALSYLQAASGLGYAGVIGFYGWPLRLKRWPDRPKPIHAARPYPCPVLSLFGGARAGLPVAARRALHPGLAPGRRRPRPDGVPGRPPQLLRPEVRRVRRCLGRRVAPGAGFHRRQLQALAAPRPIARAAREHRAVRGSGRLVDLGRPVGPELRADPEPGLGDLRDPVLPRALARPAHDEEIAPPELERARGSAPRRAQEKSPWRAEGHDGDDG